jgi:integrase
MLRSVGADIKVQQELLRHSTIQSTMNVYTQAISVQKHAANGDDSLEFTRLQSGGVEGVATGS